MSNPLYSCLCFTAAVLMMLLAGCAALEKQETRSTEQLLSAAGFDIKPADTPDKLAALQAMKQHKLVRRQTKDGRLQFLYADAAGCRCVYLGDEQAYQQYRKLAVQQIAITDQEAALDASMDTLGTTIGESLAEHAWPVKLPARFAMKARKAKGRRGPALILNLAVRLLPGGVSG